MSLVCLVCLDRKVTRGRPLNRARKGTQVHQVLLEERESLVKMDSLDCLVPLETTDALVQARPGPSDRQAMMVNQVNLDQMDALDLREQMVFLASLVKRERGVTMANQVFLDSQVSTDCQE